MLQIWLGIWLMLGTSALQLCPGDGLGANFSSGIRTP